MVLFIEGKPLAQEIASNPEHLFALIKTNMSLVMAANQLKSKAVRRCGQETLYLHQREMAVVSPRDDCVRCVGCDGAAASIVVVIRRMTTGDVSVCRFDGWGAGHLVKCSIERMLQLVPQSYTAAKFDVHLVGGFQDPYGDSLLLTGELLLELLLSPFDFHLRTACVAQINSREVDGKCFPIIQGVAYDTGTGDLEPASFEWRGPWAALRGARVFSSSCRSVCLVYDSSTQRLVIEPFSYRCQLPYGLSTSFVASLPDDQLQRWLSCSPADKATLAALRATLKFIGQHPLPLADVFGEGCIVERPTTTATAATVPPGAQGEGVGVGVGVGVGCVGWQHERGASEVEMLKAAELS